MAMFEAKKMDLTLEVKNLDGETKKFLPYERVTAKFAERIIHEFTVYKDAQMDLPESEKDKMLTYYLKFLSWVYKDLDTSWLKEHFSHNEIKAIFNWANEGLLGAKKDGES